MPVRHMEHPNTTLLREIENKAKEWGWPWDRSFSYEVAVLANDLGKDFPSDKAIAIAEAKLHELMKTTPSDKEEEN